MKPRKSKRHLAGYFPLSADRRQAAHCNGCSARCTVFGLLAASRCDGYNEVEEAVPFVTVEKVRYATQTRAAGDGLERRAWTPRPWCHGL